MNDIVQINRDVVSGALMISGSILALIASLGLFRLSTTRARMHATTKPATIDSPTRHNNEVERRAIHSVKRPSRSASRVATRSESPGVGSDLRAQTLPTRTNFFVGSCRYRSP